MSVTLKVKKIDSRAQIPSYSHDGDMCFDIRVLIDKNNIPYTENNGNISSKNIKVDDTDTNTNELTIPISTFAIGGTKSVYDVDINSTSKDNDVVTKNSKTPHVVLHPGEQATFHTGLIFETERGYGMKVHVRSSVGIKKGLALCNTTGIIDTATYRGELLVAVRNVSGCKVNIEDMERLVQGEIVSIPDVKIVEVYEVSETSRGSGGIGSTGTK